MSDDKIELMQAADRKHVVQRQVAFQLRRALAIEKRDSTINRKKLQSKWVKLLRDAKTDRVRQDMEIAMQSHKRDVDMRDAHLQQLDVDTEEAEEQTRVATNAHLQRLRKIVHLQDDRLASLEKEFESALDTTKQAFAEEISELQSQQEKEAFALRHLMAVLKEKQELAMEDAQAEYERQREILSSEHLEHFHQLQSLMDSRLQQLSSGFEDEHTQYITSTSEKTQIYKSLMLRDRTLMSAVESRKARVEHLKHSVAMWRTKLVNGNRDEQRRNSEMEEAKSGILGQYRTLKAKMRQLHAIAERRLKRMAVSAGGAKSALADQVATAERILRLHERARRLESHLEKITPFHNPKGIRPSSRLAHLAEIMTPQGMAGVARGDDDPEMAMLGGVARRQSVASVGSGLWEGAPEGPQSPVQAGARSGTGSVRGSALSPSGRGADSPPPLAMKSLDSVPSAGAAGDFEGPSVASPAPLDLPSDIVGSTRKPEQDVPSTDAEAITREILQDGLPSILARSTAVRRTGGGGVEHEELLDGFFTKYNKVLAEKLTLEVKLEQLRRENQRLRGVARQHLEGVTVQTDALKGPNPLLVVNGRSSITERQPRVSSRPRSAVDGVATARSATKIALGVTAAVVG